MKPAPGQPTKSRWKTTLAASALTCLLGTAAVAQTAPVPAASHTFAVGTDAFLLDGKPYVVRCGEIHFPRVPREYWEHRLKMAKAMGLNAVCVYLFWNYHEWEEGKFNWEGQADAAEFCRLAQKEGLWVILRPGPYSCAEWEMGGLPWWLLKRDGIQLRTSDPKFLDPATRYLKEVGRVLGPQQITHGGPILMVQVENEYGSYGKDAAYMGALRQAMVDAGFNVPLFACNPPSDLGNGLRSDLFQVVNFGSGPEKAFDALKKIQKTGPLMNGEFYPGWFDAWGRAHHFGDTQRYLTDLGYMVEHNNSFSIYMAHGGTSFGLWSGADRPFQPDTSSYDYDAPISEAGWPTDKFTGTRELFAKHLQPGETLPEPPANNPVIELAPFTLNAAAPIFESLPAPKADEHPRTMEAYDQSRGCMVYRATLPAGPAGTLSAKELHDYGWVYVDGQPAGVMDRRAKHYRVRLPARTKPVQLDLLVEAVGRVNFGKEVFDRKGLHAPVEFTPADGSPAEVKGWQVFNLPLDDQELAALKFRKIERQAGTSLPPAFWGGGFNVEKPGDTFLDVRALGKGVVWVNGHCLGRYWNIGPTQTMYLPGPWLKAGSNQITVLDLTERKDFPTLAGLKQPVLNELRPELDFSHKSRANGTFTTAAAKAAAEGSFTQAVQWQDAKFKEPVKGRYLCVESLNTFDSRGVSAIAELDVTAPDGTSIPKGKWSVLWVSSEEAMAEPGEAENALDGQSATHWHTQYKPAPTAFPHRFVLDLGEETTVSGIRYLPRSGNASQSGRIKDYRVYVSNQSFGLTATQ